jgi:RNA polymerase sigma-70 factor (ECF subfamily)
MTTNDREAEFSRFFREHIPAVRGYVRTLVFESEVETVVAATFTTAWEKFESVPRSSGNVWLFGVARNHARNLVRAERRRAAIIGALGDLRPDVITGLFTNRMDPGQIEHVLSALAELTDQEREIIQLTIWHDMRPAEIAEVLQIEPSTARVRLHRARKRLESIFDARNEEGAP